MPLIARQSVAIGGPARRLAKFGAITAALAICLSSLVAGCNRHPADTTAASAGAVKQPIKVEAGRLVLAAVAGHPASAYFKITNQTNDVVYVDGVSISRTREAEMHETVDASMTQTKRLEIDAMQSVLFSPGGHHVMVFGVDPTLKPGGRVAMTLHIEHGPQIITPLAVEPASALLDSDMAGMAMSH